MSLVSIDAVLPNGVFESEGLEMDSSDLNIEDVHKWVYEEEIPSGFNMTNGELQKDMLTTDSAIRRPRSGSSTLNTNADAVFCLKLYWENGYKWQGESDETW